MNGQVFAGKALDNEDGDAVRLEYHAPFFTVLPPPEDRCQVCGSDHEPASPHDPDSLYWQVVFSAERGRYPTWHDALAHCSPGLRALVTHRLAAQGLDVEAEYAASLAGAAARAGQVGTGGHGE